MIKPVRAGEVLALVRRHHPDDVRNLDRFLAELVSLWVASDKTKGLLEDARMLRPRARSGWRGPASTSGF